MSRQRGVDGRQYMHICIHLASMLLRQHRAVENKALKPARVIRQQRLFVKPIRLIWKLGAVATQCVVVGLLFTRSHTSSQLHWACRPDWEVGLTHWQGGSAGNDAGSARLAL